MALTGLVFIGYVLLHMYGNLKVFAGQESFDSYAEHLRGSASRSSRTPGCCGSSAWCSSSRCVVHATAAYRLWARARGARPRQATS